MKKKALIVTTVSGFVPQFEMNNVRLLQELGYEVHYASNFKNPHYGSDNHRLEGTGIICHQVDFVRSPFRVLQNLRVYRQLCKLMREISFTLIHCHTPMGGALGRLAAENVRREKVERKKFGRLQLRKSMQKVPAKVIYTAHGFHFFKGAPLFNWLFYYPVERWLANFTDALITINEEDYQRAKKFHLRKNDEKKSMVEKVKGVGIDIESYRHIVVNRAEKRKEMGIAADDFVLFSVGELSDRKNHKVVIKALANLLKDEKTYGKKGQRNNARKYSHAMSWHYFIAGEGSKREYLEKIIHCNGLDDRVTLLGYREDIRELLAIADCFAFPSKQEGLPVALLEALAAGTPCIASDIRGNRELIEEKMLFSPTDQKAFMNIMLKNMKKKDCIQGTTNLEQWDSKHICNKMWEIYSGL